MTAITITSIANTIKLWEINNLNNRDIVKDY